MLLKQRILNLAIAFDQFLFCLIMLGQSYPQETASAAAWRLEQAGHWAGKITRPCIDTILWFDPEHCRVSYENMVAGVYSPPIPD